MVESSRGLTFQPQSQVAKPEYWRQPWLSLSAMIRQMLVAQLGIADPLSIQLQASGLRASGAHQQAISQSRGLTRYQIEHRTHLGR